nr:DNA mismatch repair protein MLH1-like isoform X3 [Ipomoea batatas]GMD17434.1 DNA mismatch repair protein MLH1-like isoform X3 [Ipomoea batatas]GMD43523.1 DNA mismatch repair protein MLH1-like isoform X3 [Ipomoea batatas]GMD89860.1 DNA mismatch repair protein MLH1-like isoform X3 [Ipomoea batatas]GMD93298.1 DNA mismatch repair protein MLH1-like isoform X3 [Ipomoea batatas]
MRETYNIQVEATYRDGVMEDEPNACAAVKGTQIMIENLFYNMTARRKTLQNFAARADVHSVAIPI